MRFTMSLVLATWLFSGVPSWAQSPLEELERRLESGAPAPRAPGYLGLTADDRNTGGEGLRVVAVQPESPAEAAGLRVGDTLLEIERRPLRTTDDMADVLAPRSAGDSIAITFDREGQRHVVTVRLASRPRPGAEKKSPPEPRTPELPPPELRAPKAPSLTEEIESIRRESAELRVRLEQLERRLTELQARLVDDAG